jgi:hypothetical protein
MLNARANLSVCQNVQWTFERAKGPIKKGRDKLNNGDRKVNRRSQLRLSTVDLLNKFASLVKKLFNILNIKRI